MLTVQSHFFNIYAPCILYNSWKGHLFCLGVFFLYFTLWQAEWHIYHLNSQNNVFWDVLSLMLGYYRLKCFSRLGHFRSSQQTFAVWHKESAREIFLKCVEYSRKYLVRIIFQVKFENTHKKASQILFVLLFGLVASITNLVIINFLLFPFDFVPFSSTKNEVPRTQLIFWKLNYLLWFSFGPYLLKLSITHYLKRASDFGTGLLFHGL